MANFSPSGAASGSGNSSVNSASSFTVGEAVLPVTADTEFSFVIPAGVKRFTLVTKGISRLELLPSSGASVSWKIKGGFQMESGPMNLESTLTLYMKSPDTGDTVQILMWS